RFYLRSDDASQLYMNINSANSTDPAGRVMLIHQPNANVTMQDPRAISPPVFLNQGQRYYTEALMKEGTGGDYLLLTFRQTDANGTAVGAVVPPADAVSELQPASGSFDGAPGNPDVNHLTISLAPPSSLNVTQNDLVTLRVLATATPPSINPFVVYQWQKLD